MITLQTKLGIFIDWYLPAYKAGGPIQSIANLVSRLKSEYDICIITSNTDLGEILEMHPSQLNNWISRDGYRIIYLDSEHQNMKFYNKLIMDSLFDVVYFNSMFSLKFTLLPLWILRISPIRRVLATRGMLGRGALAIKPLKKKVFLRLFKLLDLHKKVYWHATAQSEVEEIKAHFGNDCAVLLAPNLSSHGPKDFIEKIKVKNQIRIFFLSRIAVKKNLLGALDILSKITSNQNIRFTIIGPIDDKNYWLKCKRKIKSLPDNLEVNYVGSIPNHELEAYLKEEHVLLLPTYGENFGHVIMESWQNGCPVIISDQTPWHDLERGKLGYDLAIESIQDFVKAIENIIDMSETEYLLWSKSSFDFAKAYIENPQVLDQNRALFLKL